MSRSKKIFAAFATVFFLSLIYVVYDISSRTTFPGSGPAEKHDGRISPKDSARTDTIH